MSDSSTMPSQGRTYVRGGLTHPPTLLLVGLVTEVVIAWLDPAPALPWGAQLAGAVAIVAGIVANVAATGAFERAGTAVRPTAAPSALVTLGVFRWTRNPMYVGLTAVLAGGAIALSSLWALLVPVGFVAVMTPLIRFEEARMEALFGDAYRAYRRRVRRWL